MTHGYKKEVDRVDAVCKQKFEYEVAQFDSKMRAEEIRKETEKRVRLNGGRSLSYILMPKSFKKGSNNK